MSSTLTQSENVHSLQSSTNSNGNQQPGGNKRKGCGNNCNDGRNNDNKPKDNTNNDRLKFNVGEAKEEKKKVKFPCKICIDNHLTHLYPKIEEVVRLLSLSPDLLTNSFLHNQHMGLSSSKDGNAMSGSQNPLTQGSDLLCINMVKYQVNLATHSHDYSSS
jgi:hypothetical protein